jgi:hypothetical protein
MSSRSFRTDPERLEELIEEATVDCYDEEEPHSIGFRSIYRAL